MIKEYHFSAYTFDEHTKTVRCTQCGKSVKEGSNVAKGHGRWLCIPCINRDALPYSEITPVEVLIDAANR